MKVRPLRAIALLATIACLPATSQQPSPLYNIELVIFRAATALGGAENWNAETAAPGSAASSDSPSGDAQLARVVGTLPESQLQLTNVASKLRSTGVYVPVAHVGWSQTASAWGKRAGLPISLVGLDVQGLSGTIALERGQYLHLGLTLSYAMPNPPAGLGAAPGTVFTIKESRRVRFYERNYYDHPAFGVIALVTPVKDSRPPGR